MSVVDEDAAPQEAAPVESVAVEPGGEKELSEAASTLLKNSNQMLNEEKWSRAAIGNYSASQFKELDGILKTATEEKVLDELKRSCDEHLATARNSIIAMYLSGMISLSRQIIDDSNMVNLVSIFADNHKWNIVKYLCERVLDYGEAKFALRGLADCYKNENEEEAIYEIWERLVKVDYEEADIAKSLAEHYAKQGKNEEAADYYKKAMLRYIGKKSFGNVQDMWEKLMLLSPEDFDFYLHVQKKVAKEIGEGKAIKLLNELYAKSKGHDIDTSINILKTILQYDEKDNHARKELVECFKQKYSGHSNLDDYITKSNLSQNYRAVHEAITEFEKHIAFDKGNFVYHRTWGVGRISGIEGAKVKIDFAQKRDHSMNLDMAVGALTALSKDHIWVLKATWKKDKLREKIKGDIVWALKTVIKSFGNSCDLKKIKSEISPSVLSASEWSTWSAKARDILRTNPGFGVSSENIDIFTVRDRDISLSEKIYSEFKAEKNFFGRAASLRAFAAQKNADVDSEHFAEMLSYFTAALRSSNQRGEEILASYLLIKDISGRFPQVETSAALSFTDIIGGADDIVSLFKNLKDAKFREDFLAHLKLHMPHWPDIYVRLFPATLSASIISDLEREGFESKLSGMCADCFDRFKDCREAVLWLFKNCRDSAWYKAANISLEKQLTTMIHILYLSCRDIENVKETSENRKVSRLAQNILFKEGAIYSFLEDADRDTTSRLFIFINDIKDIDEKDKATLRKKIMAKFPDFKFFRYDKEKKTPKGFIVTLSKLREKEKALAKIMDEDIPENSRELSYALSLGDLKENSEYKAAKERQSQLNNQSTKLQREINQAQIFDPGTADSSMVSFGTRVTLQNTALDRREEYVILGAWESDPDNNVISYHSPLGAAMYGKTAGEEFEVSRDGGMVSYRVEDIAVADLIKQSV
ncbi:MAG: transcription elongation factor GreA [Spirochaetes bacterium]|nr:transcription elongation factor GreA [Spirochaetota bacterium]